MRTSLLVLACVLLNVGNVGGFARSFPTRSSSAEQHPVGRSESLVSTSVLPKPPSSSTSSSSSTSLSLSFRNDNNQRGDPWYTPITEDPKRSGIFSVLMVVCGAFLGPILDSYHSAFGVLEYDQPIQAILWGSEQMPALTTAWWVPELFGLAAFLIGWLYVLGDFNFPSSSEKVTRPTPPKVIIGVAVFAFQYLLSGILFEQGLDRTILLNVMSAIAGLGFFVLDGSTAGLWTSLATAIGGPLIELGLLSFLVDGNGYHYNDVGETGFFPLWILPVYFLGGPANGNLARGFWNKLSGIEPAGVEDGDTLLKKKKKKKRRPKNKKIEPAGCRVCGDTRSVGCPNCDGKGSYITYEIEVTCPACRGRGRVICRACFDHYEEDPSDVEAIRDIIKKSRRDK